jgi:DnaJ-domain-containing protein 1
MFGIFKKKSKQQKLNEKYQKLMSEAHKLSTVNRKLSDEKIAEANEILKELEKN